RMRPVSNHPEATFSPSGTHALPSAANTTLSPRNAIDGDAPTSPAYTSHAHANRPDSSDGADRSTRIVYVRPSEALGTLRKANRSLNPTSATGASVRAVRGPYRTSPASDTTPTRTPRVVPSTKEAPK